MVIIKFFSVFFTLNQNHHGQSINTLDGFIIHHQLQVDEAGELTDLLRDNGVST